MTWRDARGRTLDVLNPASRDGGWSNLVGARHGVPLHHSRWPMCMPMRRGWRGCVPCCSGALRARACCSVELCSTFRRSPPRGAGSDRRYRKPPRARQNPPVRQLTDSACATWELSNSWEAGITRFRRDTAACAPKATSAGARRARPLSGCPPAPARQKPWGRTAVSLLSGRIRRPTDAPLRRNLGFVEFVGRRTICFHRGVRAPASRQFSPPRQNPPCLRQAGSSGWGTWGSSNSLAGENTACRDVPVERLAC